MHINGREIGPGQPPYIISEISSNHAGSLDNALALVRAAKEAGADAVKFQALQADRITLSMPVSEVVAQLGQKHGFRALSDPFIVQDGPWKGRHLYDLYKQAETPLEWWGPIMDEAARVRITCFPSVFDIDSINWLVHLGVPALKISSFELPDTELIRACAATGLPLIMSTGMASPAEISAAISAASGTQFALLHCVSAYPTPLEDMNLSRIQQMRRTYGCPVGFSDHGDGCVNKSGALAVAMGACILERHIQLPQFHYDSEVRSLPLDRDFSMDPAFFSGYVHAAHQAWRAIQEPGPADKVHSPLRRSLFAVEDIKAGDVFTIENIRSIRPGHGLEPSRIREVLGGIATQDIERGTPLKREMVG